MLSTKEHSIVSLIPPPFNRKLVLCTLFILALFAIGVTFNGNSHVIQPNAVPLSSSFSSVSSLSSSSDSSSSHHHALPVRTSNLFEQLSFKSPLYECHENMSLPLQLHDATDVRVLVTGAAGFIASHVAVYAAKHLHMKVIGVDDMSGGFEENLDPSFEFVKGDIKDDAFVEMLFRKYGPFKYVYHLAAYAAEGMSHFIRQFNYRNNLVSSVALLNQAVLSNVHTFVFTSSIAAYGPATPPMVETTVPQPEDPYGIAKYAFELDLKAAHEMFGINFVIFRPHNVYGPHQNIYDRYRNVIGIFMNQIIHGKEMTIFGDGLQTRMFSYIDDVAPVIAQSPLNSKAINQIFNVGGETPYTLLELAQTVAVAMEVPNHPIQHLEARKEVMHAEADHTKVRCLFHLPSPVTLRDGIQKMADWVKDTGNKFAPREFDEVEVLKNMPPSWITTNMRTADERKRRALIGNA